MSSDMALRLAANAANAGKTTKNRQRRKSRGRTLLRANLARIRRAQRFRPLFQTEEHASRHNEPCWLDHICSQPGPGTSCTNAAARDQLCSLLVDGVETKLPDPIKATHV